jgi:excisionase family DNA binding protein
VNTHRDTVAAIPDGRLVDVTGAAAYFGVSRRTIYRLIQEGALKPIRIGARLRFRVRDLDEYVEGRST